MDILLICRDAVASSIVSNLILAKEARRSGKDIGILFTEEALAAISDGVFRWPPQITGEAIRYLMTDNSARVGIPTMGGKGADRQIDVRTSILEAKGSQVTMFACPIWVSLLGLGGKLPDGIIEISLDDELRMLNSTRTIIGSF